MPELNPLDLFDVESQLGDEECIVRDSVARFVDDRVLPIIGECFEQQRFPIELVPEFAALGLFGCTLEGYGCAGLNNVAYGLICRELERGDSAMRSLVSVQGSLVMHPLHTFGSDAQKERWLPELAAGRAMGCFGLTEAQGGSDPASMTTHARRDGADWLLNGSKMWITNGTIADIAVIWARTDEGVRGFLIERDVAGFEASEIKHKMSLRASTTASLFLDNVRVPDSARLPGAAGIGAALSCLTQARYGIAWGAIGAAQACLQQLLGFVGERELFGETLSRKQSIQMRLADMARRISGAQLLALRLGRLKDDDRMKTAQVSLAKWNNVRMALDVARDCRDMLGASGISTEYVPIRHMLNLESVITYEGTETIHQLVVGKELTGISAF